MVWGIEFVISFPHWFMPYFDSFFFFLGKVIFVVPHFAQLWRWSTADTWLIQSSLEPTKRQSVLMTNKGLYIYLFLNILNYFDFLFSLSVCSYLLLLNHCFLFIFQIWNCPFSSARQWLTFFASSIESGTRVHSQSKSWDDVCGELVYYYTHLLTHSFKPSPELTSLEW